MPATEGGGAAGVLMLAVALALSPASVPAPPARAFPSSRPGAAGTGRGAAPGGGCGPGGHLFAARGGHPSTGVLEQLPSLEWCW